MEFVTPLRICNGMILDREWKNFQIRPKRTALPENIAETDAFFEQCGLDDVNFVHLELDESHLTHKNGALDEKSEASRVLDYFMEESFRRGLYLAFTPVTKRIRIPDGRSEHAIRDDEPIFAERYYDSLFRHVNPFSGRKFYEYENLAAIEQILSLETFSRQRFYAYLIHIRCFTEHFFPNRLLNVYFIDRGPVPEELNDLLTNFGQITPLDIFPKRNMLRIPSVIKGIRKAMFSGFAKAKSASVFLPCATAEASSQSRYCALPHANGGAEGWLCVESSGPADFRLVFPCEVREAVFRPSMRSSVPLTIKENMVSFTLEIPRYGVIEVNYNTPELPHFTAYIFMDPIISEPENALWLEPGIHKAIDYTAAKTLAFKPGVHRLLDDRLRPVSGHDIYLAQGAVLQCGLTCEKGENIRIYGSGVFDGTEVRRQPGENWTGRADDAFIHFFEGRNIEWDGPSIFNSPFWNIVLEGTRDVTIRHHKALTWVGNSDGVQPRSCVNLLIEESFFKCADDSIAIKTRRASGMHSKNIVVRNIITWNDSGSSLEIGHTSQADLLEDVRFENIEVILTSSGICHIYLIDHSTVRNIRYENIYIEENRGSSPEISFTISRNFYSTDSERGRIQNVMIKNLHVADRFVGIILNGFDEEHRIENITLENLFVHKDGRIEKFNGMLPYLTLKFADEIKLK